MLSKDQKELLDECGEQPIYHCLVCSAPDLNPEKHFQCVKDGYTEEVICDVCWYSDELEDFDFEDFEIIEP